MCRAQSQCYAAQRLHRSSCREACCDRDRQPPGFAVAGLGVTGGGLVLGWGWLSTVGIAPLIVSAAPCLIMCALGLCMKGRGRQPSDISNREAEYLMLATMSLPVSLSSSFAVAHGSGMASGMMGHALHHLHATLHADGAGHERRRGPTA